MDARGIATLSAPWVLAAAVVAVASHPRSWALGRGYIADEMGWLHPGGATDIFLNGETSVNPPLLRILLNVPFDMAMTPIVGRYVSFVASLLAVAVVFAAAYRASRDSLASGTGAALLMAWSPIAIQQAGLFRTYGVLQLVLAWHAWSLVSLASRGERHHVAHVVISAFFLPQLHYFTVPLLLVEGVLLALAFGPAWITLFVPAAVGFAPLGVRILQDAAGEHMAPIQPWHSTQWILGMAMDETALARVVTVLIGGFVVYGLLDRAQKALWIACISVALATIAVTHVHEARGDLGVVIVPFLAAFAASAPAVLPPGPHFAALLVLLVDAGGLLANRWTFDLYQQDARESALWFATDLHAGRWDALGDGPEHPIVLYPGQNIHPLYFYMSGLPILEACPPWPEDHVCFLRHDTPVVATDDPLAFTTGLMVILEDRVPPEFSGCVVHQERRFYHVVDCR